MQLVIFDHLSVVGLVWLIITIIRKTSKILRIIMGTFAVVLVSGIILSSDDYDTGMGKDIFNII